MDQFQWNVACFGLSYQRWHQSLVRDQPHDIERKMGIELGARTKKKTLLQMTSSFEKLTDNIIHAIGQYIYDSNNLISVHSSPIHYYFSTLALLNKNMLHRAYDEYFWKNQPFPVVLRNKFIFEESGDEGKNPEEAEEVEDAKSATLMQLEALMNVCQFTQMKIVSKGYRLFTQDLLIKISDTLPDVLRYLELNCNSVGSSLLLKCLESLPQLQSVLLSLLTIYDERNRQQKREPITLSRRYWKRFGIKYLRRETHKPVEQFISCCLQANPDLTSLTLQDVPCSAENLKLITELRKLERLELIGHYLLNEPILYNQIFENCKQIRYFTLTNDRSYGIAPPDITSHVLDLEELTIRTPGMVWDTLKCHTLPNLRKAYLPFVPANVLFNIIQPGVVTHLQVGYLAINSIPGSCSRIAENCQNLVSLHFEPGSGYDEEIDIDDLTVILVHCKKIKSLAVGNRNIDALLDCLAKYAPKITDLCLNTQQRFDLIIKGTCTTPLVNVRSFKCLIPELQLKILPLVPNVSKLETQDKIYSNWLAEVMKQAKQLRVLLCPAIDNPPTEKGLVCPNLHTLEFTGNTGSCYYYNYGILGRLDVAFFIMVAAPNLYECNILVYLFIRKPVLILHEMDDLVLKFASREGYERTYNGFFKYLVDTKCEDLQGRHYDTSRITCVADQLISGQYTSNVDVNPVHLLLPAIYKNLEGACSVLIEEHCEPNFTLFSDE